MAEKRINWTTDEVVLVCAEVMRNGWRGFEGTAEAARRLSGLLRQAPFHPVVDQGPKFRNPNGVGRKSYDIATRHPAYRGKATNGSKVDREVLAEFLSDPTGMLARADAIESAIAAGGVIGAEVADLDLSIEEQPSSAEGRALQSFQRRYERDPKLRDLKLNSVLRDGLPIACETCGFDFSEFYGEHGAGFIEVHHVVPLHVTGETITRLQDLALLCSNCHRMIHRRQPWLNPSQLRHRIARQRAGRNKV